MAAAVHLQIVASAADRQWRVLPGHSSIVSSVHTDMQQAVAAALC